MHKVRIKYVVLSFLAGYCIGLVFVALHISPKPTPPKLQYNIPGYWMHSEDYKHCGALGCDELICISIPDVSIGWLIHSDSMQEFAPCVYLSRTPNMTVKCGSEQSYTEAKREVERMALSHNLCPPAER